MNKNLILILALVSLSSVFGLEKTNSTKLQGSTTGRVTIYKDSYGFYVGGDFSYDYSANDRLGPYSYKMMLGLYTSNTLLSTRCINFDYYDCRYWDCNKRFQQYSVDYPYFSAIGRYAGADLYLDYAYWDLKADAFLAESCNSNYEYYGQFRSGILGMGTEGDAWNNFVYYPKFGIYLNKDLSGGKFLFAQDTSYYNSSFAVTTMYADKNWKVKLNGYIKVGYNNVPFTGKLIFDMHADAIGLPYATNTAILSYLETYSYVYCRWDTSYQPMCDYNGYISDLPDIVIVNGTNQIPIPPQVYVVDGYRKDYVSMITLNFKVIGSTYTKKNYVTNDYNDAIILDSRFMSYYYTVFDSTYSIPTITLYFANHNSMTGLQVLFLLIFVGIIIAVVCCVKAAKRRRPTTIVTNAVVAPVIYPNVVINQDHTQQFYSPPVQYTQQPYAYVQEPQHQQFQQYQQPGYPQQGYNYQQQ